MTLFLRFSSLAKQTIFYPLDHLLNMYPRHIHYTEDSHLLLWSPRKALHFVCSVRLSHHRYQRFGPTCTCLDEWQCGQTSTLMTRKFWQRPLWARVPQGVLRLTAATRDTPNYLKNTCRGCSLEHHDFKLPCSCRITSYAQCRLQSVWLVWLNASPPVSTRPIRPNDARQAYNSPAT